MFCCAGFILNACTCLHVYHCVVTYFHSSLFSFHFLFPLYRTPIVVHFWEALESFTPAERSAFLQFGWARSRLPVDTDDRVESTYRMQLSILALARESDSDGDKEVSRRNAPLPTSETCFFNVNLPNYPTLEMTKEKLLLAIQHCASITA